MKFVRMSMVRKSAVAIVGAAAVAFAASADTPDTLYFVTGGSPSSGDVLSTDAAHPTTVFEGVSLGDYEPAYIYFAPGSSSGSKYYVCPDLHNEILRPYFVVRATEDDAATMTVQYQGVTRTKTTPYTAAITIKFKQNGDNIDACVVRAASLKPFDVELGLDLNAMVDAQNPRAIERPLSSSGREAFNTSVITMRKPGAAVEYNVHEGDTISGTLAGNGAVTVSQTADEATYSGYMPNDSWVTVASGRNLADLDEVEGTYHYGYSNGNSLDSTETACNLKYTITSDRLGQKTCQFQRTASSTLITGVLVQFRQVGDDIQAKTSQYRTYYIYTTNYVDGVYVADYYSDIVHLGMDFEKFSIDAGASPRLCRYNKLATSDSHNTHGVKDLKLKFRSRATTIRDGYLNDSEWTIVAANQSLANLVQVDGFFHTGKNAGQKLTAEQLHDAPSDIAAEGVGKTCQFQYFSGNLMKCVRVRLKQVGNDVQAYLNRYSSWYMYTTNGVGEVAYADIVKVGMNMEQYGASTEPIRRTYGGSVIGNSDTDTSQGLKDLRLYFNSTGITYTAASTAPYGNSLTFSGSEGAPLDIKTTAATTFPSNGVVTVNPYTTLTLSGHVKNPIWTQYRVMTNATLKLRGTWSTHDDEQIDLVGGTLSIREDEAVVDSGTYINYLTLMDGAIVRGKPVRIGRNGTNPNWVVAGRGASECETSLILTARASDSRYIAFNVNDVANGSDFLVAGDITDYNTFYPSDTGYWDVHVVKDGAGTMEVSGNVTLPNEIYVKGGALRLAKSCTFSVSRKRTEDGSNAMAAIWLGDGALELAAGATNTVGAVVAKEKDAPINLGDGSKLTMASFSCDAGGTVLVSGDLGNGVDICIESERQNVGKVIRGIRCGADRKCVKVGENGNLEQFVPGLSIFIR